MSDPVSGGERLDFSVLSLFKLSFGKRVHVDVKIGEHFSHKPAPECYVQVISRYSSPTLLNKCRRAGYGASEGYNLASETDPDTRAGSGKTWYFASYQLPFSSFRTDVLVDVLEEFCQDALGRGTQLWSREDVRP